MNRQEILDAKAKEGGFINWEHIKKEYSLLPQSTLWIATIESVADFAVELHEKEIAEYKRKKNDE